MHRKQYLSIPLFNGISFLLIILNEISRIYVFSNSKSLDLLINFLQIPLYFGLLYLIIDKKYKFKELIFLGAIGVLLLIGYISSGQASFFRGFLIILVSKNLPLSRILKTCRIALTFIVVLSVLLWMVGISDSGIGRRGAIAIGFAHPNVAAQFIMMICLMWTMERNDKLCLKDYLLIEIVALVTFLVTGSRTSAIVIVLIPFIVVFIKHILKHKNIKKLPALLLMLTQTVIIAFAYLSAKYLETSYFLQRLDLIFSNRLFLNYYVLKQYGIKLFGQNVILSDMSGTVYNNIRNLYNWNITCDCSYMASLIIMGLIPTIIVMIGYILLIKKAIKNHDYMIISVAVLLALYSFTESRMLEIYCNFVYFYLFSNNYKSRISDDGIIKWRKLDGDAYYLYKKSVH